MDAAYAISIQATLTGKETHEIQSHDHDRLRPRAGRGRCRPDARTRHGSGFGIGVLRADQDSPRDEGVLAEHAPCRFLLYDHLVKRPGDHAWLACLL